MSRWINYDKFSEFWNRVEPQGSCLVWTGARNKYGYGTASRSGKSCGAHRLAYELIVGDIPAGLVLDHHCRNRICVNPEHLEPVTNRENVVARGVTSITAIQARKTHCKRGHEFNETNTYIMPNGGRMCEYCRYIKSGYSTKRFELAGLEV